jgi:hypothetical protein
MQEASLEQVASRAKTSVDIQQTTQHYVPEDKALYYVTF